MITSRNCLIPMLEIYFSTTSTTTIEDYTEEERDKYIQKYIDSSNLKGIFLTKEQCLSYSTENEKIKFTYIPQEVIDEKLITIAMNKASKDALEKIVDNEKITDDDDNLLPIVTIFLNQI